MTNFVSDVDPSDSGFNNAFNIFNSYFNFIISQLLFSIAAVFRKLENSGIRHLSEIPLMMLSVLYKPNFNNSVLSTAATICNVNAITAVAKKYICYMDY
jgi:hypothetical protein